MKLKIIITNQNKDIIFKGNPLNLPIKYLDIKKKSVELFDDEEPCIIHQSYAIQKLVDGFLNQFKGVEVSELSINDLTESYSFIDIENIKDMYITIKR
ncbi:MAG: hypothetical protein CVV57_09665 [Tenericutes bacterium HGW-Tenericutes-2]|jgi:hypothetical protein|nr:MAG: hypothetical protein CVV57_09665 [Tenericutes bacterium HGW-Tenericutes-2]